jgi:hypothetical protein
MGPTPVMATCECQASDGVVSRRRRPRAARAAPCRSGETSGGGLWNVIATPSVSSGVSR